MEQFKPGDECKRSGVYRVVHDRHHTQEHEVTVVHGTKFPPCHHCGPHPRFVLERGAQHIDDNEWFKQ